MILWFLKKPLFPGCLLGIICSAGVCFASPSRNLEIYISGKKYATFQDYKIKELTGKLKIAYVSSGYKNFDSFKKHVLAGYSEASYGVSRKVILDVLAKIKADQSIGDNLNKDLDAAEIKQMQGALDLYNAEHPDEAIQIDPEKVKTIIIAP